MSRSHSLLVIVRHGESEWNEKNLFTGWEDVGLTARGEEEAKRAGEVLRRDGIRFDTAFTSVLKRSIKTLWLMQEQLDLMWIPVHKSWRLNERHYGDLQGLDKIEMAKRHGAETVKQWRRSYAMRPPQIDVTHPSHPSNDVRYRSFPDWKESDAPTGESLRDTYNRVVPYYRNRIAPELLKGKNVLISAHGNSLRALVKLLLDVSDDDIVSQNIPTGIPRVFELNKNLRPVSAEYHGDPDEVQRRIDIVANQTRLD